MFFVSTVSNMAFTFPFFCFAACIWFPTSLELFLFVGGFIPPVLQRFPSADVLRFLRFATLFPKFLLSENFTFLSVPRSHKIFNF